MFFSIKRGEIYLVVIKKVSTFAPAFERGGDYKCCLGIKLKIILKTFGRIKKSNYFCTRFEREALQFKVLKKQPAINTK
jgi:hypothetical protein